MNDIQTPTPSCSSTESNAITVEEQEQTTLDSLFLGNVSQPVQVVLVDEPHALPCVDLTDLLIELNCEV